MEPHLHGTRERVFEHILEHHGARVEEVAESLGVKAAAIRRHLDHLRADGLIESRPVKQATGRPYLSWYPTSKGAGEAPPAYADLFARVLGWLGKEHIDEAVATGVAASLAERHRDEVAGSEDVEDLVEHVTESLRREGILETWRAEADGYHLVNSCCPYPQAAELSRLPCEADRQAISLLIGKDVEQIETIVEGSLCCEYRVQLNTDNEGAAVGDATEGNA
ncbi:MAG: hypothetical protein F4152_01210 [Dehalococcoidia bacterium]|nr:hypothetical protein [Dehalococcoidia bacterium]